jgi:hypothetical protein
MKYCGYCSELMLRGSLSKHCLMMHSAPNKALKKGEKPVDPIYRNWPEWIKDPANTIPRLMTENIAEMSME